MISSSAGEINQEVGQLNKLDTLLQSLDQHSVANVGIRVDIRCNKIQGIYLSTKIKGQLDNLNHPSKIQLPQMPLFSPVQKIPKVDQTSRKDARTSENLLTKLKQCY